MPSFSDLPRELRDMIWRAALKLEDRVIPVDNSNSNALGDRDSDNLIKAVDEAVDERSKAVEESWNKLMVRIMSGEPIVKRFTLRLMRLDGEGRRLDQVSYQTNDGQTADAAAVKEIEFEIPPPIACPIRNIWGYSQ